MVQKTCATCNRFFEDNTRPKNRLFCSRECGYKAKCERTKVKISVDPGFAEARREKGVAKRLKQYGISLERYKEMLAEQNGVCKTCHQPCRVHPRLSVDHDHKSGRVRGLLCHHCNNIVKLFDNAPDVLARIVDYVR
jgi:hypothetical protein